MISNSIRQFYNRFPYPLADLKKNSNVNGANLFKILEIEIRANKYKGTTILDVGCGTGHRILDVAKAYPEAEFHGFDIAEKSIEVAKKQAAKEGVDNITFEHGNITDYHTDQLFDIMIANGVIHHLAEPAKCLQNLTRFLKPNGLFIAWVLHTYGEFERMLQRDLLLSLLSTQKENFESGRALMREMGLSISKKRYGNSYSDELTQNDELSKDADAFLNPQVTTFTFEEAVNLFRNSEIDWVSIEHINFQEHGYFVALGEEGRRPFWVLDILSLLNSTTSYNYYKDLTKVEKLHVIELAAKPTGFTIFAGKSGSMALASQRIKENRLDINAP